MSPCPQDDRPPFRRRSSDGGKQCAASSTASTSWPDRVRQHLAAGPKHDRRSCRARARDGVEPVRKATPGSTAAPSSSRVALAHEGPEAMTSCSADRTSDDRDQAASPVGGARPGTRSARQSTVTASRPAGYVPCATVLTRPASPVRPRTTRSSSLPVAPPITSAGLRVRGRPRTLIEPERVKWVVSQASCDPVMCGR